MNRPNQPDHVVWDNGSWSLRTAELRLPDGTVRHQAYVDHPGAVVLVPLLDDGRVLMIEQFRLPFEREMLELPAGTRHDGESWLRCAQRELREETGYRAAQLIALGDVLPVLSYSNERLRVFLAQTLTPDPLPQDDDEQIALRPMPLPQLVAMALNGELEDAKSIAGVLRASHHLGQLR